MIPWPAAYVGMPYKWRGRARPAIDCWGLVRLVLWEQRGIALPAYDTVDEEEAAQTIATGKGGGEWLPISEADMREFDFVLMRHVSVIEGRRVSVPSHIGIVAPNKAVLHVREDETAVLQPFHALRHRVTEICRHRGLT